MKPGISLGDRGRGRRGPVRPRRAQGAPRGGPRGDVLRARRGARRHLRGAVDLRPAAPHDQQLLHGLFGPSAAGQLGVHVEGGIRGVPGFLRGQVRAEGAHPIRHRGRRRRAPRRRRLGDFPLHPRRPRDIRRRRAGRLHGREPGPQGAGLRLRRRRVPLDSVLRGAQAAHHPREDARARRRRGRVGGGHRDRRPGGRRRLHPLDAEGAARRPAVPHPGYDRGGRAEAAAGGEGAADQRVPRDHDDEQAAQRPVGDAVLAAEAFHLEGADARGAARRLVPGALQRHPVAGRSERLRDQERPLRGTGRRRQDQAPNQQVDQVRRQIRDFRRRHRSGIRRHHRLHGVRREDAVPREELPGARGQPAPVVQALLPAVGPSGGKGRAGAPVLRRVREASSGRDPAARRAPLEADRWPAFRRSLTPSRLALPHRSRGRRRARALQREPAPRLARRLRRLCRRRRPGRRLLPAPPLADSVGRPPLCRPLRRRHRGEAPPAPLSGPVPRLACRLRRPARHVPRSPRQVPLLPPLARLVPAARPRGGPRGLPRRDGAVPRVRVAASRPRDDPVRLAAPRAGRHQPARVPVRGQGDCGGVAVEQAQEVPTAWHGVQVGRPFRLLIGVVGLGSYG